jgi:hypothetical protein
MQKLWDVAQRVRVDGISTKMSNCDVDIFYLQNRLRTSLYTEAERLERRTRIRYPPRYSWTVGNASITTVHCAL